MVPPPPNRTSARTYRNSDGRAEPTTTRHRQHNRRLLRIPSRGSTSRWRSTTFRCARASGRMRTKRGSRCRGGRGAFASLRRAGGIAVPHLRKHLKEPWRSWRWGRKWQLTYSRRLLGLGGCLIGAAVCFFVSFMTLPSLAVRCVVHTLSSHLLSHHILQTSKVRPRFQVRVMSIPLPSAGSQPVLVP